MNSLILLFLILYVGLAIVRLDWAIMLMLATLPAYLIRGSISGIPFTLLEAMILVSFFIYFISRTEFSNFIRGQYSFKKFKENKIKRIPYPFGLEIILLLIISFIAVAISDFNDSALGIFKAYFFEPALVFLLVLNLFAKDKKLNKILWPLAVSALAISVLAIYQQITGNLIFNDFWADSANRRVVSFFGYPNAVGLYLAPIILLLTGWLFQKFNDIKKKVDIYHRFSGTGKFLIIFTITLSLLAIYFAKSKGALVGVGVGLIVFVFLAVTKKIRWALIGLLLITAIGILSYAPLRNYTMDKTIYSKSIQIRRVGWRETLTMLKDGRTISGVGLANYQKTIKPYHQEGVFIEDYRDPDWLNKIRASAEFREQNWQPLEIYLYPHNIFLNFWSELGLAGMLLFIWIIIKYLIFGFKCLKLNTNNKYLVLGLIGAMIVIIVHGLVDVPYFKNDLAIMFWVLVGMMSLQHMIIKK